MTAVVLTDHAGERISERIGTRRDEQFATEAWEHGISAAEVKGSLRRFIDGKFLRGGGVARIHRGRVWIFVVREGLPVLVTVYDVPRRFVDAVRKMSARRAV